MEREREERKGSVMCLVFRVAIQASEASKGYDAEGEIDSEPNTQHTTHNTQHTTHNTRHITHNTQHTTHNTQQEERERERGPKGVPLEMAPKIEFSHKGLV